jgi:hypothetical protein
MYRIDRPAPQQMLVRHVPRSQRVIGLLFVLAGASILLLVFPTRVRLRCDRQRGLCTLEQSGLLRSRSESWAVEDLMGAKLETVDGGDGRAYRIWVTTRHGARRFTPYSIGSSWEKKRATVARIETFARRPSIPRLDETEDERALFYPLAAGIIGLGLLPLVFVRTAFGRLDRDRNQLSLAGGGLFGFEVVERPLSDLAEVTVETKRGRMFRLTFRMRTGETIPFTYHGYPDEGQATAVAHAINAFLTPGPGPDRPPAG